MNRRLASSYPSATAVAALSKHAALARIGATRVPRLVARLALLLPLGHMLLEPLVRAVYAVHQAEHAEDGRVPVGVKYQTVVTNTCVCVCVCVCVQ